jgi:hypothetical protein
MFRVIPAIEILRVRGINIGPDKQLAHCIFGLLNAVVVWHKSPFVLNNARRLAFGSDNFSDLRHMPNRAEHLCKVSSTIDLNREI